MRIIHQFTFMPFLAIFVCFCVSVALYTNQTGFSLFFFFSFFLKMFVKKLLINFFVLLF